MSKSVAEVRTTAKTLNKYIINTFLNSHLCVSYIHNMQMRTSNIYFRFGKVLALEATTQGRRYILYTFRVQSHPETIITGSGKGIRTNRHRFKTTPRCLVKTAYFLGKKTRGKTAQYVA